MEHRGANSFQFPPSAESLKTLLPTIFKTQSIAEVETLSGGLINLNLKVSFLSNHKPVVVRFFRDGVDVCQKELAIHQLVRDSVPVPAVLHSDAHGVDGSPPFQIREFVDGITFQTLKRNGDSALIKEAAYSAGKTLAVIGGHKFERPGKLVGTDGTIAVGETFIGTPDSIPKILDRFLESHHVERRAGQQMVTQIRDLVWRHAAELRQFDHESSLVHSDFGSRNLLVQEANGKWEVASVLDWEFAFSGPPLLDVGHFVRYEAVNLRLREPEFSRGFVDHGGKLPDNWCQLAQIVDLTGLVESLTHDDLPNDIEQELLNLIATSLRSLRLGGKET